MADNKNIVHSSELAKMVTLERFEKAFNAFSVQALENSKTHKANGKKVPFGFSKKVDVDGAIFGLHYGQGGATKTPYMNWWVASIYFLPEKGEIVFGIEENRYPHLAEMSIKATACKKIGNKPEPVAIFYTATKDDLKIDELYEIFLNVCEEIMRVGLK